MTFVKASYSAPDISEKQFTIDPSNPRYQTTNGKTTGASDHVLNAGQIDRDKPSEPRKSIMNPNELTYLGRLRTNLTGLQDDINQYLTQQMEIEKNKKNKLESLEEETRIEEEIKELLDGGDSDGDCEQQEREAATTT